MRKNLLVILIILGLSVSVSAQDFQAYFRTDLISGAPQPGDFAVGDQAVRAKLPTGGVQFSLPLFNVSGEELSLGLSLQYSYDGFRPHERVGWLGLGWELGGTGKITRVPFGQLDENAAAGRRYQDSYVQSRINNITIEQDFLHDINEAIYDSEPDVYVFQFGEYSGKFIHFKGKFYCFPDLPLQITGTGDSGFVITTESGQKYSFQEPEYTHSKGNDGEKYLLPNYVSTWHLSRIESVSGKETVLFQYETDGTVSEGGYFSQTYKVTDPHDGGGATLSPMHHSYPTKVDRKRLRYIIAPRYTVSLIPGDEREDLSYVTGTSRMLGGIDITNTQSMMVRQYTFNHDYFGTSAGFAVRYLKLASVQEIEPNAPLTPPSSLQSLTHIFEYNGESSVFPSKIMAATDRYGYYTGRGDFSTNMIPATIHPSGPDRSVSLAGTVMGALNKVTYPTGGNTQISYALNRKRSGTGYQTDPVTYTYVATGSIPPPHDVIEPPLTPIFFTIDHAQDISLELIRRAIVPYGDNNARNTVDDVEIYRMVSGTPNLVYAHAVRYESDSVGVSLSTHLEPGLYRIDVIRDVKERWVSCALTFRVMTNIPIPGEMVGGLRVETITDHPLTGPAMTRRYSYLDDGGFDTGADARPDFAQSRFEDIIVDGAVTSRHSTIYRPVVAQSPPFSQLFYYRSVDELRIAGTDTLKTRHRYREYPPEYHIPPEQYATLTYKKQPLGGWALHHKDEYTFSTVQDTVFHYLRPIHTMAVTMISGYYSGPEWAYEDYRDTHTQVWKRLDSRRTVQYQGADSLVTLETYAYGPNHRYFTRRVLSRTAEPSVLTRHKYPQDYTALISGPLVSAHLLNHPLEVQQWTLAANGTDSTLISLQVIEYHGTYFKPQILYDLKGTDIKSLNQQGKTGTRFNQLLSDSRLRMQHSITYNPMAQPVQHQQTYGPVHSYRYGYPSNALLVPFFNKGMEIVMQAVNATVEECYLEDFEHDPTATIGDAHTGQRYRTGTYAVSWARPNARSYTIDYWYLQSGEWHYDSKPYTGPTVLNAGTAIDDVRIYPSDASISSYTHLPGIGLGSEIGPQGQTERYIRDSFHRLQSILDTRGKVRQHYHYNYKN